ncbi:hypothetical protein CYLTODRAFT_424759 [Cylindrobasidium torrendii FP15055 ss-10]|uniref:F-box domain-containing protein n=1 Tax=Cylindrobasidium torrendii FP15055 ss-10 TaxID=1314674 RepID=A0A0D7B613_9AGAR|nr:hypothetical protein CYLTODRAFT_424759 [Cylindrobasidium torrendii FP15055 ss-10]
MPELRSKRRKLTTVPDNASSEKTTTLKRPGKRARGSKGSAFQDLPYDIILEIAMQCHPLDLIHLARVSKDLRAVLLTKSSGNRVWATARQNLFDMPAPWGEISEPAWAGLCFIRLCTFCASKIVHNITFEFCARICPECFQKHTVSLDTILDRVQESDPFDEMDLFYDINDLEMVEEKWDNEINRLSQIFHMIPQVYNKRHYPTALVSDYERMAALFEKSGDNWKDVRPEKDKELRAFEEHVIACQKWKDRCDEERRKELESKKSSRRTQVQEKLTTLGFGEIFDYLSEIEMREEWEGHKLIKGTSKLTQAAWDKMKVDIIEFASNAQKRLEAYKQAVSIHNRQAIVRDMLAAWKRTLPNPLDPPLPSIADILALKEVTTITEQPYEVAVTREDFTDLFDSMADIADDWRTKVVNLWANELGLEDAGGVFLARNAMLCRCCVTHTERWHGIDGNTNMEIRPLWPSEAFSHRCFVHTSDDFIAAFRRLRHRTFIPSSPVLSIEQGLERHSFSSHQLLFNPTLRILTDIVIKTAGLNKDTATTDDMDALCMLFECSSCAQNQSTGPLELDCRVRLLMNWRDWLAHAFASHDDDVLCAAQNIVGHQYDAGSEPVLDGYTSRKTKNHVPMYRCLHCLDMPDEMLRGRSHADIVSHCSNMHNIQTANVAEGTDYVRAYGSPAEARLRQVFYTDVPTTMLSIVMMWTRRSHGLDPVA